MGQYLAIGITNAIVVNKEEGLRRVENQKSFRNALNQRYNPTGLYDCVAQGKYVVFTLKEDILLEEWTSVLETFYKLRYPNWTDDGNVLKALKETNDPQLWFSEKHEPMRTSGHLYGEEREYY